MSVFIFWIQLRCLCVTQGYIFRESIMNRNMKRATGSGYGMMNLERVVGVDYRFSVTEKCRNGALGLSFVVTWSEWVNMQMGFVVVCRF